MLQQQHVAGGCYLVPLSPMPSTAGGSGIRRHSTPCAVACPAFLLLSLLLQMPVPIQILITELVGRYFEGTTCVCVGCVSRCRRSGCY